MPFSKIIGNDSIKEHLLRIARNNRVGNSLLFSGPEGVGKTLFAEAFAKLILGHKTDTHPDLHIYAPEGKIGMHSLASMRALSEEVYLPPYEAKRKIFIVQHADRMLSYSANALLKTFEEPSLDTIIILLSSSPEHLLPTILSRCGVFRFQQLNEQEIAEILIQNKPLPQEKALQIASLSHGSLKKAFQLCEENECPIRKAVIQMLTERTFQNYSSLIVKIKEIAEQIESKLKQVEESSRDVLLKGYSDKLTASQRDQADKEIEGVVAMRHMQEADAVFDLLLSWYRDLHLLQLNGNSRLLYNGDQIEALQTCMTVKLPIVPLESLFDAIKRAKLALARSTSLHLCLEQVFLRLNRLLA